MGFRFQNDKELVLLYYYWLWSGDRSEIMAYATSMGVLASGDIGASGRNKGEGRLHYAGRN